MNYKPYMSGETKPAEKEGEKSVELAAADYLFLEAIKDLTNAINKLRRVF